MGKKIHYTTPEMERVAERIGASQFQIINWRYRGVARGWRNAISAASRGRIKLADFKAPKEKKR